MDSTLLRFNFNFNETKMKIYRKCLSFYSCPFGQMHQHNQHEVALVLMFNET